MLPPGLGFISVSPKAWAKIEKTPIRSFYFDLRRGLAKVAEQDTPFTPANTLIKAQLVSLKRIRKEGIENLWARHAKVASATRAAVKAMGLEIFAERAQSHEGKLQVELARLQYLSTRLVRRWSHLERQRGGIGTRGGPGEAQIELDRRMIDERIKTVKRRLESVKKQRKTQRRARDVDGVIRGGLSSRQCFQDQARLAAAAAAQLDHAAAGRQIRHPAIGVATEQAGIGARQPILRQHTDYLEQRRTNLVIQVLRRQDALSCGREPSTNICDELIRIGRIE